MRSGVVVLWFCADNNNRYVLKFCFQLILGKHMATNKPEESRYLLPLASAHPEDPDEQKNAKKNWKENLKGILAAFIIVASIMTGVTSVQLLERRVPDLELQAFRCVAIASFCLLWKLTSLTSLAVPISDIPAVLLYGLFMSLESTSICIAYALVPATTAQCSISTVSLMSGVFIFWLCGQEKFSLLKVGCVALCVVGVVLVIQPWHRNADRRASNSRQNVNETSRCLSLVATLCTLNFPNNSCVNVNSAQVSTNQLRDLCAKQKGRANLSSLSEMCGKFDTCSLKSIVAQRNTTNKNSGAEHKDLDGVFLTFTLPPEAMTVVGIIFAGFSGLLCIALSLVIKKNPCVYEHKFRSLFWAFAVGLIWSTILTFILEDPVWPKGHKDIGATSAHCISAITTWYAFILSLQYTSGTIVSIIISTSVVFLLIPQYTILASLLPGNRNWMEVTGAFMVLLGSFLASLYEMFYSSEKDH